MCFYCVLPYKTPLGSSWGGGDHIYIYIYIYETQKSSQRSNGFRRLHSFELILVGKNFVQDHQCRCLLRAAGLFSHFERNENGKSCQAWSNLSSRLRLIQSLWKDSDSSAFVLNSGVKPWGTVTILILQRSKTHSSEAKDDILKHLSSMFAAELKEPMWRRGLQLSIQTQSQPKAPEPLAFNLFEFFELVVGFCSTLQSVGLVLLVLCSSFFVLHVFSILCSFCCSFSYPLQVAFQMDRAEPLSRAKSSPVLAGKASLCKIYSQRIGQEPFVERKNSAHLPRYERKLGRSVVSVVSLQIAINLVKGDGIEPMSALLRRRKEAHLSTS